MIEIKAPNSDENIDHYIPRIFLAGSIEMGVAENWQTRVARDMTDYEVVLLNPRRDDWDSSWKQSIDDPQFNQQVTWELDRIDDSEIVIFYFDPNTKSQLLLWNWVSLQISNGVVYWYVVPMDFGVKVMLKWSVIVTGFR